MSPLSTLGRRSIGLVAAPVLALGALAVVPSPSYAAPDPTPATNGAAWLADELVDGAIPSAFGGNDYGLSIDAALALIAVDDQPDAVAAIAATLADNIDDYVTGEAFGDAGSLYAGATAKAAAFATLAGEDPTDFGSRDLIADLEGVVSDEPGLEGRIQDVSSFGDFANTIGQSFAAGALGTADSAATADVVSFLLDQQCAEGFFRLSFADPDAADQTCDGDADASASTDVTALALLSLDTFGPFSTGSEEAKTLAVDWLLETQGADGSWGGDAPTTAPNANSTGLAAWALAAFDDEPAVAAATTAAATWLRARQGEEAAPCVTGLADDVGAIAYDDGALLEARANGISDESRDQFRRTTAQALPALLATEAGSDASRSSTSFARAGSTQEITLDELAPGQALCIAGGAISSLVNADATGAAGVSVVLPDRQTKRKYSLSTADGSLGVVTYRTLTKKKFKIGLKSRKLVAGKKQRVTVRGLVKGESLTIRYQGRAIERARASGRTYTTTFDVVRTKGKQRVQVFGQFGNRNGAEKFRVVKRR